MLKDLSREVDDDEFVGYDGGSCLFIAVLHACMYVEDDGLSISVLGPWGVEETDQRAASCTDAVH